MGGRIDIDDEALDRLDRAWRGASDGIMWPLAIGDALDPASSMTAWASAGALDPRCLWWTLARFGADAMATACDELDDLFRARAIDWMRQQSQIVWMDDQPTTVTNDWRFRRDPSGTRIWEMGAGD